MGNHLKEYVLQNCQGVFMMIHMKPCFKAKIDINYFHDGCLHVVIYIYIYYYYILVI